ncbi:hypothetical protein [Streptomyces stelliscabiei]|uniref:hypothetical protein n=1 Tax=Streptomyces stelliscabiei TaxID=146820 RepID=UPI002FEECE09
MASSSVTGSSSVERLNICPVIRNSLLMCPSTELGVACMNSSGLWTRPETTRRLARSAVVVSPMRLASTTAVRAPSPARSVRHRAATSYANGLNADSTNPGSRGSGMSSGRPVPCVAVAVVRTPSGERRGPFPAGTVSCVPAGALGRVLVGVAAGAALPPWSVVVTAAPGRVRCWRRRTRR